MKISWQQARLLHMLNSRDRILEDAPGWRVAYSQARAGLIRRKLVAKRPWTNPDAPVCDGIIWTIEITPLGQSVLAQHLEAQAT